MKTLARVEKTKEFWFLLGLIILFFMFRLPSFFEPYWYGDEGIYHTIGRALDNGRLLYRDIWDNKPPLLYMIYALFNSDQFVIRFVSAVFGMASVISFYFLSKQIFTLHFKTSYIPLYLSTGVFAFLFAIPTLEGNIANAENFMLLPIITAASLLLSLVKKDESSIKYVLSNRISPYLIGTLLSLAFLTKVVAVFDLAAFLFFLFLVTTRNETFFVFALSKFITRKLQFIRDVSPILIGFFTPIILTVLYFIFNDALSEFLKGAFTSNIGYVSYENTFLFAQGFLILKLILLGAFCVYLFSKRSVLGIPILFIITWFAFSLFNSFFSQRPYTHYLLVLLPSFSLFAGLILFEKKFRTFFIILFVASFIILVNNFWIYSKFFSYYQNFFDYILGTKTRTEYHRFFDKKTPRDYTLADFINSHLSEKESIFVWGNNAQLYTLTNKLPPGRFTVLYHITTSKETIQETEQAVRKIQPKYIVVMDASKRKDYPVFGYKTQMIFEDAIIYEYAY